MMPIIISQISICTSQRLDVQTWRSAIKEVDCSTMYRWVTNNIATVSSAMTLLVGWLEGHPACKKLSGGMLG